MPRRNLNKAGASAVQTHYTPARPVNSRDILQKLLDNYDDEEFSSFREDLLRRISSAHIPMTTLNNLVSVLGSLGFDVLGAPPGPKHCARCHETYESNGTWDCYLEHEWEDEAQFCPKSVDGHFSERWLACKFCPVELPEDGDVDDDVFLDGKESCFEGCHTQEHCEQFKDIEAAIECRERGCPLDKLANNKDDEDEADEEMA